MTSVSFPAEDRQVVFKGSSCLGLMAVILSARETGHLCVIELLIDTTMNTKLALPAQPLATEHPNQSWATRYNNLVNLLETGDYRFTMMGAMLLIQGCVLTPVALLVFQYFDFGYSDIFAGVAVVAFFAVLVANLGLLSVRFCLNLFVVNVLLHLVLLGIHLFH